MSVTKAFRHLKITKEVKTALLVILAIVLLIFGYYFLKGNNLLDGSRTFYAVYDDVEGLAKSSKVTINGLEVGKVLDIEIMNQRANLLITFTVENDFKFSKNSIAKIYGGGIIGGKSLAIVPSYESGNAAKAGDTLKGEIEEGLLELVNERLTPLQIKVESVIENMDSLVNGVNDILVPTTRKNFKSSIASLNRTMKSFESTIGTLNSLLKDNQPKLDRTFSNLDEMSGNFNRLSDSLAEVDINGLVRDFEQVALELKEVAGKINSNDGTVGKLMNDPTVYDNIDRATKQLEELLQDIKLNPKRYIHISVFGKRNEEYKPPKDSLK